MKINISIFFLLACLTLMALLIGLSITLGIALANTNKKNIPSELYISTKNEIKQPALTVDNLLREICKNDIKFPMIVLKQAVKESGWLKCENCALSNYNNIFGFQDTAYLQFDHWTESIVYYKKWQSRKLETGTIDYYEFLKQYWGAPNMDKYNTDLKNIQL